MLIVILLLRFLLASDFLLEISRSGGMTLVITLGSSQTKIHTLGPQDTIYLFCQAFHPGTIVSKQDQYKFCSLLFPPYYSV